MIKWIAKLRAQGSQHPPTTPPDARCAHVFVNGFGGMGDAVVCVKCNLSKYPEALSLYSSTQPIIQNDGEYLHRSTYPYVVLNPSEEITPGSFDNYRSYFNREGKLEDREPI